ncbi:2-keto-4-pentenoate hydratase [Sporolactobacillus sp. THM19-2]|jgi:2-oxo-hept-3-ene-1,7-dioate hydratase|uniref:2-keto-4-pentenoate hydratase n=1 Tax=Sporolactobacillus sp. THM19-2 TaxID=2511171 RepID=UPI0010201F76|nr:2-keto-4-pentenoate hydratase [Sporolactobacillus sp. THM19-2]RYL93244.1 2-keto-4-pentenoate hydratase [Sporolactobacillus sp. THM19-2]
MVEKTEELAQDLYEAYQTGRALRWEDYRQSGLDPESAYDVQHAFNSQKGEAVKGYKISLTSKQTQDMFHSDSPLYGQIVASAVLKDGAELSLSELNEPLLELELEFTAEEDLSVDDDEETLLKKTSIAPGIEVPDSRFGDWFPKLPLELVISDSAVCGRVVVGPKAPELTVDQLSDIHTSATFNGQAFMTGVSSEVLGNPVKALKWLVTRLAREGKKVTKGTTVSTGTFCLPEKLKKGDYVATFDHGVGTVTLHVR